MASQEERMRILNMLQEGQVSPEQAAQLLQAIDEPAVKAARPSREAAPVQTPAPERSFEHMPPAGEPGKAPRWLRVRVSNIDTGRPKVNIRLPVSLVGIGLKMGKQFAPDMENIDFGELMKAIQEGDTGTFVDVVDEDDGEHVEIFLE
jgi:hypothetical protein